MRNLVIKKTLVTAITKRLNHDINHVTSLLYHGKYVFQGINYTLDRKNDRKVKINHDYNERCGSSYEEYK